MSNLVSFTPLLRSTVGFDRFGDLIDQLIKSGDARDSAYPPYNIEKTAEDAYRVVMAVAGFAESDLTITAQGDQLLIEGRQAEKADDGVTFLHRGIGTRAFQRSFRLADHIKVRGADMRNGLLTIQLVREVPEEARARTITIGKPTIENGGQ